MDWAEISLGIFLMLLKCVVTQISELPINSWTYWTQIYYSYYLSTVQRIELKFHYVTKMCCHSNLLLQCEVLRILSLVFLQFCILKHIIRNLFFFVTFLIKTSGFDRDLMLNFRITMVCVCWLRTLSMRRFILFSGSGMLFLVLSLFFIFLSGIFHNHVFYIKTF